MIFLMLVAAFLAGYQTSLVIVGIKMHQDSRIKNVTIGLMPGMLALILVVIGVFI